MEVADRAVVLRAGKEVANVSVADTSIEELSYFMVARKEEKSLNGGMKGQFPTGRFDLRREISEKADGIPFLWTMDGLP